MNRKVYRSIRRDREISWWRLKDSYIKSHSHDRCNAIGQRELQHTCDL
jgi:hypothetical protein